MFWQQSEWQDTDIKDSVRLLQARSLLPGYMLQLCRNLIIRVAISSRSVITGRDGRNVRARTACDAINAM